MTDRDTAIGGASSRFPATRQTVLEAAASQDAEERRRGFEILLEAYWKPVYKYIRLKWRESNEDAKDLTQGFFAKALEKGYFGNYDPSKAAFRTYLRTCLDGYLSNQKKSARRIKRGGGTPLLSLDWEDAEGEIKGIEISDERSAEDYFHQEWVRSLFSMAVRELQRQCQGRRRIHFELFCRYDLDDHPRGRPTYAQLAEEYAIAATDVTNHLAAARRRFRQIVLGLLRQLTAGPREFELEARSLLGREAP